MSHVMTRQAEPPAARGPSPLHLPTLTPTPQHLPTLTPIPSAPTHSDPHPSPPTHTDPPTPPPATPGHDKADATCSTAAVPDYVSGLQQAGAGGAPGGGGSAPLRGIKIGLVAQTLGEGVQQGVNDAVLAAARHMEGLGAVVE